QRVQIIPMAVGARSGMVDLWINPGTHADHRIVTRSFEAPQDIQATQKVQMTSVDDFMAMQPIAFPVSFIKIDVQGYEEEVCRGLEKTLIQNPQAAIAVEYFPEGMQTLGFRPEAMLEFFEKRGYVAHHLRLRQNLEMISSQQLREPLPA